MKRLLFILLLLCIAKAQAQQQYWGSYSRLGPWIVVTPTFNDECNTSYKVIGGVPQSELEQKGLLSVGAGREGYGYYEFNGEWEVILPDTAKRPYLMWPPSLITLGMLYQGRNNVWYFDGCEQCGCTDIFPLLPDTTMDIDAFGFWRCDSLNNCGFMPGINTGYIKHVSHPSICLAEPCPAYYWEPKRYLTLAFADSTYQPLPDSDNFIISGDSPLYITAHSVDLLDSLWVWVILEKFPIKQDSLKLQRVGLYDWHGKAHKNARQLGLKSYARAAVLTNVGSVYAMDEVDVCLPIVVPSRDTIIIRTDSMKISENPSVSLFIVDDSTGNIISTSDVVQSAGYKYKSRWTANANFSAKKYYRQFPASIFYRQWNGIAPRCQVTFNRDSLYTVGGLLTIECKGQIKIPDTLFKINNSFLVSTDTPNHISHDTLQTMKILVDKDPDNSLFFDSLQYDIIKAIAWQEYAGSNDTHHCQDQAGHYNLHYNNYWDDFISGVDTCHDTKTPCENIGSTASGIMQMLRTTWDKVFTGQTGEPTGYTFCKWDSTEWNWKINIHDGKYIFFTNTRYHIYTNNEQSGWDSICTLCNAADSFPQYPNKEDLSVYGYKYGAPEMAKVKGTNWNSTVKADVAYTVPVRSAKYRRPWQ